MCKNPRFISPHGRGEGLIMVGCGQCEECERNKSLQWSYRLMLEAEEYPEAERCFITLTYDNEHCDGLLHKEDVQKFIKRVRKNTGDRIRYFACGEYGARGKRPHYHCCLFGHHFVKSLFYEKKGINYYRSMELESLWQNGYSLIQDFDDKNALYICKYMQKSIYKYLKKNKVPKSAYPFILQSRKPPIGIKFLEKCSKEDILSDKIYKNGKYIKYPRTFHNYLERRGEYSEELAKVKNCRILKCKIDSFEEEDFYRNKYKK